MESTKTAKPKKRMGFIKKILICLLSLVLIFVLVCGITIASVFNSGKPKVEGELSLSGLTSEVSVTRDENGVPHIVAQNKLDVYYVQGFVHAQDRIFQMDLSRRLASGRLSEVFGDVAVQQDQYYLTLGLRRAAEKSLPLYEKATIDVLTAYANGVNAYIDLATSRKDFPPEFTLLGYTPEPWSPVDTLTLGKLMAHDLGGHWKSQVFRQYLLETFSEEEAYELFPDYPRDAPTIIKDADLFKNMLTADIPEPNENNGSNNWVVSGSKTRSGKPLLANDPHLSMATPSIWYINHLKAEEMEVSGSTFAGVPGIILGQNQFCAWGVTNTSPDVQDVYMEKINPSNPLQCEFKGKWEDMQVHHYTMKVKNAEDIPFEVKETVHGPIISGLAGKTHSASGIELSLRWTALDATLELEGLLEYNLARTWDEFEKGLEKFQAPTQNFVFASVDGTIAYKANGRIPIRDNNGTGLLPVEGWTGENEWLGFIPFNELPTVINPESGFIATANYKVTSEAYPYHISNNWSQPYRQMRIEEVLSSSDALTAEDMRALQDDTKNLRAVEFAPIFAKVLAGVAENDSQIKQALVVLEAWGTNGYFDEPEEAGAVLFNVWMDQLAQMMLEQGIDPEVHAFARGTGSMLNALILKEYHGEKSIWLTKMGGLEKALVTSLHRTVAAIEPEQGADISKWEYGKYHKVGFLHPLSAQWYLKPFFNPLGNKPSSGSDVTVRAAGYRWDGLNNHGASWRFIADFSDLSGTQQIVGPGISGHPASPYYQDQIQRWIDGELYRVDMVQYGGKKLVLKPV